MFKKGSLMCRLTRVFTVCTRQNVPFHATPYIYIYIYTHAGFEGRPRFGEPGLVDRVLALHAGSQVEGSTPTGGTCPNDFSDPIDQDIRTQ